MGAGAGAAATTAVAGVGASVESMRSATGGLRAFVRVFAAVVLLEVLTDDWELWLLFFIFLSNWLGAPDADARASCIRQ